MKKIAIIGGHGFIGKNFTEFFLNFDFTIILVGKNSGNDNFPNSVQSIIADIQNTKSIIEAVKDAEIVIWLASSLIPGSHEASLQADFETNIKPVIAFLEKTNNSVLKKFVYLSSGGTVYGDTSELIPLDENHSKNPISEYGLSKLVTENYIQFITQSSNYESYILRPSNVYGKYQNLNKPQGIIGFAFKSLINNTAIDLYDDGKVIRDFVFVTDVAEAVLKCINAPQKPSKTHIYNVGNGKPFSIKEMIFKIGKVAGRDVVTTRKLSRNFDCEYNVLSFEHIKNDLNWKPKIEVEEGLKEVWEWIKEIKND
ncbi:NAD-dependent epimerase/dehydratase family protein [Halpernia sp. GG3]